MASATVARPMAAASSTVSVTGISDGVQTSTIALLDASAKKSRMRAA